MQAASREALHEAGHAVLAVLLGRKVERVSVRPRPQTRIVAAPKLPRGRPRTDAQRARLESEIMLAVAGLAAERALDLDDRRSLLAAGADLHRATDLALQLAGRARAEPTLLHFLSVAQRMLRSRQDVLLDLAQALEEAGELDGADVHARVPRR
ncbi:MAG: hypothetical protein AAFU79_28850 [Myxococcota bacterium]